MEVFFIIVSFTLNIFLILAVLILYLRQNKLFGIEETQKRTVKEMEELISTYLLEMKEENEQFIHRIKDINDHISVADSSSSPIMKKKVDLKLPIENNNGEDNSFSNFLGKTVSYHAVKAYEKQKVDRIAKETNSPASIPDQPIFQGQTSPKNIHTKPDTIKVQKEPLVDQLMTLKKEGLTEEEMAKKLNKGKTEIALLLKFQQKREE